MTPLVIMVVFTTIVTPILLKFVFPKNGGTNPEDAERQKELDRKHAAKVEADASR